MQSTVKKLDGICIYVMGGLKDQLVRLEDEDDAGHEDKGASGSQPVARVLQEEVAQHHYLQET